MVAASSTEYEDFTVHQQIGPETDAVQGWPLYFPDGTEPQPVESTQVRSGNWSGFRDPNESIYFGWIADVHTAETELSDVLAALREDRALDAVQPDWLTEGIGRDLLILPFVDRAYFRALSRAQRLALSDTVTLPLVFEAADKLRHVEHAVSLRTEVENAGAPDIFADVRSVWATSELWRPLRETVETLLATEDWLEAVVAINVVLDPLIGHFLRTQYLRPAAEANNDRYTPAIVDAWQRDSDRARRWTLALIDHLTADPTHGAANSAVIDGWLTQWRVRSHAAAQALAPLLSNAPGRALDPIASWRIVDADAHTGDLDETTVTAGGVA